LYPEISEDMAKSAELAHNRHTEPPLANRYAGIYCEPKPPVNLKDFGNQQAFLSAAALAVPKFAASLLTATFRLTAARIKSHGSLPRWGAPDFDEYSARFVHAVRKWAKDFHIEADWVIREAVDAALTGLVYYQRGIDPVKAFGTWRRPIRGSAKAQLELPAWQPYMESEQSYIARLDAALKEWIDSHIAAKKSELAGVKPVPARRKRGPEPDKRFEWAALHRCIGTPIKTLADQNCECTEVVRISVSRVLKDLGF
jgi:hypothetical protein